MEREPEDWSAAERMLLLLDAHESAAGVVAQLSRIGFGAIAATIREAQAAARLELLRLDKGAGGVWVEAYAADAERPDDERHRRARRGARAEPTSPVRPEDPIRGVEAR